MEIKIASDLGFCKLNYDIFVCGALTWGFRIISKKDKEMRKKFLTLVARVW